MLTPELVALLEQDASHSTWVAATVGATTQPDTSWAREAPAQARRAPRTLQGAPPLWRRPRASDREDR